MSLKVFKFSNFEVTVKKEEFCGVGVAVVTGKPGQARPQSNGPCDTALLHHIIQGKKLGFVVIVSDSTTLLFIALLVVSIVRCRENVCASHWPLHLTGRLRVSAILISCSELNGLLFALPRPQKPCHERFKRILCDLMGKAVTPFGRRR